MGRVPVTSITLLKVLGRDAQSPRWTEFANKYASAIEGYLLKYFPEVDAEEVVNETLCALVNKLPFYEYAPDEKGHFRNYLLGIVRYKALDQLKKKRRAPSTYGSIEDMQASIERESLEKWEYENSLQRAEIDDWRKEAYEAALAQFMANPKLSPRDKEIFRRTALCGESPAAVAEVFGIKRNNVDQIKARMTARLKELALKYVNVCRD